MWACDVREELFPPGQVHTHTRCTRRTGKQYNIVNLAALATIKQVVPDRMGNKITLDILNMASYYKLERQDK